MTVLKLACAVMLTGVAGAMNVTASFYQAVPGQTSGNPRQSACGPTRSPWTQIAVSRDLRRTLPCGTRVRVTLHTPKGGRRSFTATVNDTMSAKWRNKIDILVGNHKRANTYGLTGATVMR